MAYDKRVKGADKKTWQMMTPHNLSTQVAGSTLLMPKTPIRGTGDDFSVFLRATSTTSDSQLQLYNTLEDTWSWRFVGNTITVGAGTDGAFIYELPIDYAGQFVESNSLSEINFIGNKLYADSNDNLFAKGTDVVGLDFQICNGINGGVKRKILSVEFGVNPSVGNSQYYILTLESSPFPNGVQTGQIFSRILRPHYVIFQPSTTAANNTLSILWKDFNINISQTNNPGTFGTIGRLISTPSVISGSYFTNIATSASSFIIEDLSQDWKINEWTNYQVRILSGKGEGQRRTIVSNTASAITVSNAWTITPDSTSVYSLEACDDFIYLLGNNSSLLFRYQFTTATWTSYAAGYVYASSSFASVWIPKRTLGEASTKTTGSSMLNKNGNLIYILLAGSGCNAVAFHINNYYVDYIKYGNNAAQWTSNFPPSIDYDPDGDYAYVHAGPGSNNIIFKIDFANPYRINMYPFSRDLYIPGSASTTVGERLKLVTFLDEDGNKIKYLYHTPNATSILRRLLIS
jgi:hypothetical protein